MKRISFIQEMREAIQDGRKTMTRRAGKCPYKVGDLLGVGEPHQIYVDRTLEGRHPQYHLLCVYEDKTTSKIPILEAHVPAWEDKVTVGSSNGGYGYHRARGRSGRFLPDPFIRETIRVTDIRVERLQQITPEDARREGAPELSGFPIFHECGVQSYVRWFAALWDSINGKRKGMKWSDNPEVFVISFERESKQDDEDIDTSQPLHPPVKSPRIPC